MRIAVIDDERPARSELIHQLRKLLPGVEIEEASSGNQALELMGSQTFDLLFIDIHLGDVEGTVLAGVARKMMPQAYIIFATAYSDYAAKAFELEVDDYILKPFSADRLAQVLARYRRGTRLQPTRTAPVPLGKLAVTNSSRHTMLIDIQQVVYVETDGHGRGCIIHTTNGDYTENSAMSEYEKKLVPLGFYRIHKSYLVQLRLITDIFPWTGSCFGLHMQGFKEQLPIGRDKIKELRQLLQL